MQPEATVIRRIPGITAYGFMASRSMEKQVQEV